MNSSTIDGTRCTGRPRRWRQQCGTLHCGEGTSNNLGTVQPAAVEATDEGEPVSNSTIDGNNAPRAGGGIEFFAKAGQLQTASLTNVTLSDNTTGSAPGNGGGVHITGPGNMTITGCTVTGNMAALEGGGLWNGTGTMTVNSSTIDGNTAAGALADQGGGGIFNNAKGTLIVQNGTLITNNMATGAAGSGGGILCDSTATLTVSNSTIDGNSAPRAGVAASSSSPRPDSCSWPPLRT
ncbi:MAG: right-handed parallel beta-helix repeat-containing protein [Flavobacteriales bacterium]|nr:right-handed parallel beta-helix repeat-containing protein [Flavobacteriales bacterium]